MIEDSAGGTEINNLDKLFDAYFTTKDAQNGTGLGLYISKVIVEKNFSGTIEATNTNNGLSVMISMPLEQQ
jgi:signal transduction histidine kinase